MLLISNILLSISVSERRIALVVRVLSNQSCRKMKKPHEVENDILVLNNQL